MILDCFSHKGARTKSLREELEVDKDRSAVYKVQPDSEEKVNSCRLADTNHLISLITT